MDCAAQTTDRLVCSLQSQAQSKDKLQVSGVALASYVAGVYKPRKDKLQVSGVAQAS